ncbi:N-acetylmuramoyl-L-alanine amidase [Ureibacillus chungkukjangi]|nr:N-acetylmuramoyl-L-alanine amidase [Ureibacillus chungkukjangi]
MSIFFVREVDASQIFSDIPSNHKAYDEINYLVKIGVVNGYKENGKRLYKPGNVVTRAQAANMVVMATGNLPITVSTSSFSDVKVGTWQSGYIEKALSLGFFPTIPNGKFRPNEPLTNEEMSYLISKAFKINIEKTSTYSSPFLDITSQSDSFKYINAVYFNGITQGNNNYFRPDKSVVRSDFALYIARAKSSTYRLDFPTAPSAKLNDVEGQVEVTVDDLNIRSTASTSTNKNIIGQVNKADKLDSFGITNGWIKVAYRGKYGYVSTKYVKHTTNSGSKESTNNSSTNVNDNKETITSNVHALVTTSSLNIRSGAGTTFKVIGKLSLNTKVVVNSITGHWVNITYNGITGYVSKSYVKILNQTDPSDILASVITSSLNIRSGAGTSYKVIGKLSLDTIVTVNSVSGEWAKITYNGVTGYVSKSYIKTLNQSNNNELKSRIIILDPGHGGSDPGAINGKVYEKNITLNIATLVKQKLEVAGAKVYMTRTGDTYPSLEERVNFAESNNGEVFISIHVNSASSSSAKGTETYYYVRTSEDDKEDINLASAINDEIVANLGMRDRGIENYPYYVIKNTTMPSVLVELGFITNSEDRSKMTTNNYVNLFATSIYNGIEEYYRNNK